MIRAREIVCQRHAESSHRIRRVALEIDSQPQTNIMLACPFVVSSLPPITSSHLRSHLKHTFNSTCLEVLLTFEVSFSTEWSIPVSPIVFDGLSIIHMSQAILERRLTNTNPLSLHQFCCALGYL